MPAVGFTKPGHEGWLKFEDAPEWYAEFTEVPAEAIAILVKLEGDARRYGVGLSPSAADSTTTCRRQLAIKKFLDYLINGVQEWQATEGTTWHKAFEVIAPPTKGWLREVLIPDQWFAGGPRTRGIEDLPSYIQRDPLSGSLECEVFPGIWMNGKVDKLRDDCSALEDFKTKAWGGYRDRKTKMWKIRHYPPEIGNAIQLNLYRRMVEVCTGVNPGELTIRRMYRGARDPQQAWKKYDIQVMSNDELEARIRDFTIEAQDMFATLRQIVIDNPKASKAELQDLLVEGIKKLPMEGLEQGMLNSSKCSLYCTQQPICYEMAGMVDFDSTPEQGTAALLQVGE